MISRTTAEDRRAGKSRTVFTPPTNHRAGVFGYSVLQGYVQVCDAQQGKGNGAVVIVLHGARHLGKNMGLSGARDCICHSKNHKKNNGKAGAGKSPGGEVMRSHSSDCKIKLLYCQLRRFILYEANKIGI